MAKHLAGHYLPGRRAALWKKIKPRHRIACVIIGYTLGHGGLKSLLVAADWQGSLDYMAEITSGLSAEVRTGLTPLLLKLSCRRPVVPCQEKAAWVRPELYCHVSYTQRTPQGRLRSPRFLALVE